MTKPQISYNSGIDYWIRLFLPFAVALVAFIPAILLGFNAESQANPVVGLLAFGVAIVAGAYILGWIGEAAELDLSGGLALGILALIAIMPEYVVEIYFSWSAGNDPSMIPYATANLTGANRIVQGFGWPLVALIAFFSIKSIRSRKQGRARNFGIQLESETRTDIGFLILASLIMLTVPPVGSMHLLVGIAMVVLYCIYLWRIAGTARQEPELEGTAAYVGSLPKIARRIFIGVFLVLAGAMIFLSAHPFGDSLLEAGRALNIDEYLLVQWLAPLASEAPEFTLAFIFAARGKQAAALAILISSKLNQWTLLAGSMPIAYVIGGGTDAALPVTGRSGEELWLTTAQTILGIAILLSLRWNLTASLITLGLFILTLIPDQSWRTVLGAVHIVVAGFYLYINRSYLRETIRTPFTKPKY